MKTSRLPVAAAAAAAVALALPTAAYASQAPASVAAHALTDCRTASVPLTNPNTNQLVGYLAFATCSGGTGSFYVSVSCPDGSVNHGNTVTMPSSDPFS